MHPALMIGTAAGLLGLLMLGGKKSPETPDEKLVDVQQDPAIRQQAAKVLADAKGLETHMQDVLKNTEEWPENFSQLSDEERRAHIERLKTKIQNIKDIWAEKPQDTDTQIAVKQLGRSAAQAVINTGQSAVDTMKKFWVW